jgi:hypothetical protein
VLGGDQMPKYEDLVDNYRTDIKNIESIHSFIFILHYKKHSFIDFTILINDKGRQPLHPASLGRADNPPG